MFAKVVGSGFSLKISNLRVKYAGLGTNDLKGAGWEKRSGRFGGGVVSS
jgi:hypothetical protein